ncbi:MAG TPA: hypothetical protein VNN77_09725 [candidate division Zixibacteria bacterium]|nr:hypothetical protein [candidate division Zixibacteria bacterium]
MERTRKRVVGVLGASLSDAPDGAHITAAERSAARLGEAVAARGCVLITGATTGLPARAARACRERGGLAVGVSPAANPEEHVSRYRLPDDGADVIVYTGFGLKGRNVITVRSADVVIVVGGATGTLNEFTIACDEGKVIGVLEGSGGVADHIREIVAFCKKPVPGALIFERDPETLLDRCLEAFERSRLPA